jgi:hypothetical protein
MRHRVVYPVSSLAALLVLLLAGCAGFEEGVHGTVQKARSIGSNLFNRNQAAGARLLDPPQKVSSEFDCPNRPQPWVLLQEQEVWPSQVSVKDELRQTFIYVLCPARGESGLRGTLTRRILGRDSVLLRDAESDYELKPGRWKVDLFLTIPEKVGPGSYEFEVSFETSRMIFRDVKGFTVVGR